MLKNNQVCVHNETESGIENVEGVENMNAACIDNNNNNNSSSSSSSSRHHCNHKRGYYYYLGIDAHQLTHTAVLADGFETFLSSIEINSDLKGVKKLLRWLSTQQHSYNFKKQQLVVGVEGGGRYRDLLLNQMLNSGYCLYEINPVLTKHQRSWKPDHDKNDFIDASLVVEVLSCKRDTLTPISHSVVDDDILSLYHWVRVWEDQARQSARLKNQIKRLKQEINTAASVKVSSALQDILEFKIQSLKQLQRYQRQLRKTLSSYVLRSQAKYLTEVKGISIVLAARLMAYIKDVYRFRNIHAFIKYAGLSPTSFSSGQTRRHRVNKSGNRKLNSVFYLIALNQIRWNSVSLSYFEKKLKMGKTKSQALRFLMKRIACIIYGLMRTQSHYKQQQNNSGNN